MPGNECAALAGIEQDQRLLGLDAVGQPVLKSILTDTLLLESVRAALVVRRDQIEASALRLSVRGSKQNERVAPVDFRRDAFDHLVELIARGVPVEHSRDDDVTIERTGSSLHLHREAFRIFCRHRELGKAVLTVNTTLSPTPIDIVTYTTR